MHPNPRLVLAGIPVGSKRRRREDENDDPAGRFARKATKASLMELPSADHLVARKPCSTHCPIPECVRPSHVSLVALTKPSDLAPQAVSTATSIVKASNAPTASATGQTNVFRSFAKQEDAIEFLDDLLETKASLLTDHQRADPACPLPCRIFPPLKLFSVECKPVASSLGSPTKRPPPAGTTSRRFLVSDLSSFWRHQQAMEPRNRHSYELVRPDTPATLFFDIEFPRGGDVAVKYPFPATVSADDGSATGTTLASALPSTVDALNLHLDGTKLLSYLLYRISTALHEDYGVVVGCDDVIILDSSTASKFSIHLHFRPSTNGAHGGSSTKEQAKGQLPVLFRDVDQMGRWVKKRLIPRLERDRLRFEKAGSGLGEDDDEVLLGDDLCEALWAETQDADLESLKTFFPSLASSLSFSSTSSALPAAPTTSTIVVPPGFRPPLRKALIIDSGVYTKNRAMRMLFNSKLGKGIPLMPAACNRYGIIAAAPAVGSGSATSSLSPLSLEYWQKALTTPVAAATPAPSTLSSSSSSGTSSASSPASGAPQVLVQVGPAAWEKGLWQASLITGCLPPMTMMERHCKSTTSSSSSSSTDSAALSSQEAEATTITAASSPVQAELNTTTKAWREHCSMLDADLLFCTDTKPPILAVFSSSSSAAASFSPTFHHHKGSNSSSSGKSILRFTPRFLMTSLPNEIKLQPWFDDLVAFICCAATGPILTAESRWKARYSGGGASTASSSYTGEVRLLKWSAGLKNMETVVAGTSSPSTASASGATASAASAASASCSSSSSSASSPASIADSDPSSLEPACAVTTVTVIELLTFEVTGTRYCNNIRREHSSNGIKMTVDLRRGTLSQTCWDMVSCGGYRSPSIQIPTQLLPSQLPLWRPGASSS
jgi:Herpesviridae UL52/UL70 DNA primase